MSPLCIIIAAVIMNGSKLHKQFHMFWTLRPFGRKQILPIKSFLATQPTESKLTLWGTDDLTENPFLKPYLPFISFRLYNATEEAKGTVLEGGECLQADDPDVWLISDLFRILILHKYGGVYVDMDSVFMRDFSSLTETEFMYRWGLSDDMISGAVMSLQPQSDLSFRLMDGILQIPATAIFEGRLAGKNWDSINYARAYEIERFCIYPCEYFNPEWVITRTPEQEKPFAYEPFKVNEFSTEMFPGSYVWHWHNRWEDTIEPGCKFELLERITNERLAARGLPSV